MNRLPEHRRVIHGRTWASVWTPASMDPISHYSCTADWLGRLLAVGIGSGLALVLVAWIDWSLA